MNPRSLLVVDSDPAVHEHLTSLLQREDRTIYHTYDGGDALKRLRGSACDLVLAGQGRNGLGGITLLRKIRALQPASKVIVAADQNPLAVVEAIRYRAYSYFHKPLAFNPLAEMVQQALESTSWKDDLRVISASPDWVTLEVRCKWDAAERTTQYMREIGCELPASAREDVTAAFRELLMNAIEHGAKSDPRKRVRVSLLRTSRFVLGAVQDPGRGFSFDLLPHAAISNPEDSPTRHVEIRAEEGRRPGGFGILMTRNLVDELLYNERGNAVMFVKYLDR